MNGGYKSGSMTTAAPVIVDLVDDKYLVVDALVSQEVTHVRTEFE